MHEFYFFDVPRWGEWKEFEASDLRSRRLGLKDYEPFLLELERDIESFLPEHEITDKLIRLFELGQKRCNVILLLHRSWNSKRGCAPYYDYMPHFLFDLLSKEDTEVITEWIRREHLSIFFKDGIIQKEYLLDLAGTGKVRYHLPKDIKLPVLLDHYIHLLELREIALSL